MHIQSANPFETPIPLTSLAMSQSLSLSGCKRSSSGGIRSAPPVVEIDREESHE